MASQLPAAPFRRAGLLAVVGTTLTLHGLAAAQECGSGWLEIVPERAISASQHAWINTSTMWDPDGAEGPQVPVLVVGGSFTRAGGRPAFNVATWDGERWAPLGAELTQTVASLAVQADGTLIASTEFRINSVFVWQWNGTAWQPLLADSAASGRALALCPLPDGNLVFGGSFQFLNMIPPALNIGTFDGTSVTSMGGNSAFSTRQIKRLSNGDLVSVPLVSGNRPQRWNGSTWATFGTISNFTSFSERANGELIGGADRYVRRWDGIAWTPFGGPFNANVLTVGTLPDDSIIAVHGPYNYGIEFPLVRSHVSQWDGTSWTQIGYPTLNAAKIFTIDPNGRPFLGATGLNATAAQVWTGSRWSYPAESLNGPVSDIAVAPNGDVLVAGDFDSVGTNQLQGLARRDAASPSGYTEIEGPWTSVSRIAVSPAGTVFVLAMIPELPDIFSFEQSMLARVGAQSVDLLGPPNSFWGVQRIEALSDNELIAVGGFTTLAGVPASRAAIWNGTTWAELQGGLNGSGQTVTRLPTGGVVIGGSFTTVGPIATPIAASNIAIWQNAAWSPLAGGVNGTVNWVRILQDGSIAAAGAFTAADGSPASGFATWNGTAWTGVVASLDGLTPISISEFTELPSGDIVARGTFRNAQGVSQSRLARLHNTVWSALIDGNTPGLSALEVDTHGELLVGGNFGYIDNTWSYFARYADAGSLWLALKPTDTTATWGSTASLTVQAASGYDRFGTLTYTWTHNEQPVIDDGRISGASTATLNFAFVRANDAGAYVCTVSNGCGTAISETANLEVVGCAGDFDADGDFDSDDIIGFFQAWDEGNDNADADNDGDTDSDDLIEFFTKWDQGSCD